MVFLSYTHNPWLVIASLLVALMAGFTGLSLTRGLSECTDSQKKMLIVLAAITMGGGIWSMHFVAMLGLRLPVAFYYNATVTLASALVAILAVGVALLLLHFVPRRQMTLFAAGIIIGLGILAMHYIGMAGLELCQAFYTPFGVFVAIIASCLLNILTVSMAYGKRTQRNIVLGTLSFGLSVFSVHFVAILGTQFTNNADTSTVGLLIDNEIMALGIFLSSFVLCGAFLLTGITFLSPQGVKKTAGAEHKMQADPKNTEGERVAVSERAPSADILRIPYEQEGRTFFAAVHEIAAIRADGHYTYLYTSAGKLFCIWSITEATKRLCPKYFIRTHRSYLVNPRHVSSFERLKDNGVCHFNLSNLERVPVSRSHLSTVRQVLGV